MTKDTILRMLAEGGGATTEYPFIEWGYTHLLNELLKEGLLLRIGRPGDLAQIRMTDKGREVVEKLMPRLAAVIFDMDGVLIDSYDAHFRSWRKLAEERGRREYTEDEFVAGFGRTSREVIVEQWGGDRLSDDEIAAIADRKEALWRDSLDDDFPAMAGGVELIEALLRAGIRVGVGSSGPPENVHLVLERLGIADTIEAVVTGGDVTRGKPDPQVFQLVAERLGVTPGSAVVIEDAPVGIQAARAAGMKVIGVASTGRTREELAAADRVISELFELTVADIQNLFGKS